MAKENHRESARIVGKGMLLGITEAIPGVSASSIALMLGIYGRIIAALASIRPKTWRQGWPVFRQHLDGALLVPLIIGMVAGLWLGASVISSLLDSYRPSIMGVFVGLLSMGALAAISDREESDKHEDKRTNHTNWSAVIGGILFGLIVTMVLPAILGGQITFPLWLAALFAAPALLLPGISGSFVLLVLGAYETMIHGIRNLDFGVIAQLFGGMLIGGAVATQFIDKARRKWGAGLTQAMGGVMLGAMPGLWPWMQDHQRLTYQAYLVYTDPMHNPESLFNSPIGIALAALAGMIIGMALTGHLLCLLQRITTPLMGKGSQ